MVATASTVSASSRRDSDKSLGGKSVYAIVQYDFTQSVDGELTVAANDRVKVINPDDGKGWMLVRFFFRSGHDVPFQPAPC